MTELTPEQAALFRAFRPKIRPIIDTISAILSDLARACPHDGSPDKPELVEDCPVCALYAAIRDAELSLHDVPDFVDTALTRGPHPMAKKVPTDEEIEKCEEAYQDGWMCFQQGVPWDDNEYPAGTAEAKYWKRGWIDAQREKAAKHE